MHLKSCLQLFALHLEYHFGMEKEETFYVLSFYITRTTNIVEIIRRFPENFFYI